MIFFGIGTLLSRAGLHPARCFMAGVLVVLGGGLLFRGLGLVSAWYAGTPFPFPGKIGAASGGIGIIALIIAGLIFWRIAQSHASAQNNNR